MPAHTGGCDRSQSLPLCLIASHFKRQGDGHHHTCTPCTQRQSGLGLHISSVCVSVCVMDVGEARQSDATRLAEPHTWQPKLTEAVQTKQSAPDIYARAAKRYTGRKERKGRHSGVTWGDCAGVGQRYSTYNHHPARFQLGCGSGAQHTGSRNLPAYPATAC